MTPGTARAAGIGALALALAVSLAACGDDTAASGDASSSTTDALAAYTSCLEAQGIDLPDGWTPTVGGQMPGGTPPSGMPGGAPSGMPEGEMPGGAPEGAPQQGGIPAPDGVDEAAWQAAQEACADQLPQMGGGTPPGGAPAATGTTAAYLASLAGHEVTYTVRVDETTGTTVITSV